MVRPLLYAPSVPPFMIQTPAFSSAKYSLCVDEGAKQVLGAFYSIRTADARDFSRSRVVVLVSDYCLRCYRLLQMPQARVLTSLLASAVASNA